MARAEFFLRKSTAKATIAQKTTILLVLQKRQKLFPNNDC